MAAIIREALDRIIEHEHQDPAQRVFRSVGRFGSGRGEVVRDHDRDLSDAFGA